MGGNTNNSSNINERKNGILDSMMSLNTSIAPIINNNNNNNNNTLRVALAGIGGGNCIVTLPAGPASRAY